jgi:ribA/ribD-fused uncharacterized protein
MDANTEKPVLFYDREFYCLSNFSAFALEWKGFLYMTSEHAYHTEKFTDENIIKKIQESRSAYEAFNISREYEDKVILEWMNVRLSVMEKVIREKINQHEYVRTKLLETGDRVIIEDSPRDSFWGWGPNKDGENQLGKIWMKLREELKPNN